MYTCCSSRGSQGCGGVSANEIREAIRTAEAAACAAEKAAKDAEKLASTAEQMANAAEKAACGAEKAAQNAAQCAQAAQDAKDRIVYMLNQLDDPTTQTGCGCAPSYTPSEPDCGCGCRR